MSPGPPGPRPRREITVFIEASAGPLGAGHCGRATVFAGSRADPFRERGAPRLNYVFIQGLVVLPGAPRDPGGGAASAPRGGRGLQRGGAGCGSGVGGLRIFAGARLRRRVYHISPGALWPRESARLCAEVGWVGSALLINAAVR